MKLFSGSGTRVNNAKSGRSSESQSRSASRQRYSSSYGNAGWEEDEPRIVKEDGSSSSAAYHSPSYQPTQPDYSTNYYNDEQSTRNVRNYTYYTPENNRRTQKKRKRKRRLIPTSVILAPLAGLYCLCVFTNIKA